MKVIVTGGCKTQRKFSESLARFCSDLLMSKRLQNSIHLDIQLVPNLMKKEEVYGDSCWEDNNWRPREFTVRADSKLRMRRLLETIAHEMVHVKQFAKGEMVDLARADKIRWCGKMFEEKDSNYYDYPWEIEAHGRECGLFVRWAQAKKLSKEKWANNEDFNFKT